MQFANKTLDFIKTWRILFIYIMIILFGFYFNYEKQENFIASVFSALDVSSAVALALLAGVAYWQYSLELSKRNKFLKQLQTINSSENKDALLGIQFGGSNKNAIKEMEVFAKEIGINDGLIKIKIFGDNENKVSKNDMIKLENFLKNEFMPQFTNAQKVHLIVSGAGIAFYTCVDILSNWKPIIVYHRSKDAKYEVWTTDNKHRVKIEENLSDIKS